LFILDEEEKKMSRVKCGKNVKMRKLKNNEFKILMWGEKRGKIVMRKKCYFCKVKNELSLKKF